MANVSAALQLNVLNRNVANRLFDSPSQLSSAVFRYQTIDEIRGRDINM